MSRGTTPPEAEGSETRPFCEDRLSPTSLYRLLHEQGGTLFPDEAFADLFTYTGRASIPSRIVATVMVLQRLEGLSDREAVERFTFDLRWKFAAGGLHFTYPEFVHTVLVDMRARLRDSARPDRIFDAALALCRSAGLVGRKRVLDSTALYDAVATQDTVTLIRSSIRALLRASSPGLQVELRAVLCRDDDYASAGKPACDWDDKPAREALVDALARDAHAVLALLHGRTLPVELVSAAELVATVVGQDLEKTESGEFRIAKRVAKDRVISTVDPEARHGHKTEAHSFDGYKGHIAMDPDSELITATVVTGGNEADGASAAQLLAEILPPLESPTVAAPGAAVEQKATAESSTKSVPDGSIPGAERAIQEAPGALPSGANPPVDVAQPPPGLAPQDVAPGVGTAPAPGTVPPVEVYGDGSYGAAEVLLFLEGRAELYVKVAAPASHDGLFTKERFQLDLEAGTVTCPSGQVAPIRLRVGGEGSADFKKACGTCPLRGQCTQSKEGRKIRIHPQEKLLSRERERQRDEGWKKKYRTTRPKVERKIAHLMRRRHGGRRARVRGRTRVGQDFALLAAALNLSRLAVLHAQARR